MHNKIVTLITLIALSSSLLLGKTLVTVNGHNISDSIIPPGYEKLDETQRSNLMEQLIKEELLHSKLLKSSLVQSSEFKKVFQEQKKLTEQQYKEKTGKNLTKDQIRAIKGSIAVALYQQKKFKKAKVTNSEIKEFYNQNPQSFQYPDSIEIADIIVESKSEADKILKKLQKSTNLDKDFILEANKHKQNGYMGWFGKGSAPENLFNKAFKYKNKRLLNTPVKTKHGYNVVYLLNKKRAGTIKFSEAKERIKQMLKQKKVVDELRNEVNDLYGSAEIIY
jgi:parvulin-like peptidyl-prolyl isomerase